MTGIHKRIFCLPIITCAVRPFERKSTWMCLLNLVNFLFLALSRLYPISSLFLSLFATVMYAVLAGKEFVLLRSHSSRIHISRHRRRHHQPNLQDLQHGQGTQSLHISYKITDVLIILTLLHIYSTVCGSGGGFPCAVKCCYVQEVTAVKTFKKKGESNSHKVHTSWLYLENFTHVKWRVNAWLNYGGDLKVALHSGPRSSPPKTQMVPL